MGDLPFGQSYSWSTHHVGYHHILPIRVVDKLIQYFNLNRYFKGFLEAADEKVNGPTGIGQYDNKPWEGKAGSDSEKESPSAVFHMNKEEKNNEKKLYHSDFVLHTLLH